MVDRSDADAAGGKPRKGRGAGINPDYLSLLTNLWRLGAHGAACAAAHI